MRAGMSLFGRKLWTRVGIASLALCAAGCIDDFDTVGDGQFGSGPSCESLCEEANECEGSEPTDCQENCEEVELDAERAGCLDVFNDFMSCAAELSDICTLTDDECAAEIQAYGECLTGACEYDYDVCADL
jgi:hypothetical protein